MSVVRGGELEEELEEEKSIICDITLITKNANDL